jgi:putative nucleotidyltransferase with HDIG domain
MTEILFPQTQRLDGPDRRRGATHFLEEAREQEKNGRMLEAMQACTMAIELANEVTEPRILAEALRRLGSLRRRRHEAKEAAELCARSYEVAMSIPDSLLAAEALNGLALIYFALGDWDDARRELKRALELGAEYPGLRGSIEQNLGIMANAEGDLEAALEHYERSLELFKATSDKRSQAMAYNNLGMLNADHERWAEADECFRTSLEIADSVGDVKNRGHALLNRSEVLLARGEHEEARRSAEAALQIFDDMGARDLKSEAYKFIGMVYRDTGKTVLAEERLKASLELSIEVGATLSQAETTREMAILYRQMGRNQETLKLLTSSHRLFGRLNARRDLVDVASKTVQLEQIYLDIVKQWGASLESSDTYTHGHSERVANYSLMVAQALGLDQSELTAIRVGAYLHDLGKVRVPHEILNKPGKLTNEEFATMKMHPVFGIEMLASVDFPWDIKPIIRSHHEKLDGSGYPDRLRGDEIALSANIVCIADVFDALTTTRSYRSAMDTAKAVGIMLENPEHWRAEVVQSFMETLGGGLPVKSRAA